MDSASILAKHITLSNKDVEKLVNMEYSDIASYSKNKDFFKIEVGTPLDII